MIALPVGEKAAGYSASQTQRMIEAFADVLPMAPAAHIFEAALDSPNVVIHVAGSLLSATAVERAGDTNIVSLKIFGNLAVLMKLLDMGERQMNQAIGLGAARLVTKYKFNPDDVEEIIIRPSVKFRHWFSEAGYRSVTQEQFSIPYGAACAMYHMVDPKIIALMMKVKADGFMDVPTDGYSSMAHAQASVPFAVASALWGLAPGAVCHLEDYHDIAALSDKLFAKCPHAV